MQPDAQVEALPDAQTLVPPPPDVLPDAQHHPVQHDAHPVAPSPDGIPDPAPNPVLVAQPDVRTRVNTPASTSTATPAATHPKR